MKYVNYVNYVNRPHNWSNNVIVCEYVKSVKYVICETAVNKEREVVEICELCDDVKYVKYVYLYANGVEYVIYVNMLNMLNMWKVWGVCIPSNYVMGRDLTYVKYVNDVIMWISGELD